MSTSKRVIIVAAFTAAFFMTGCDRTVVNVPPCSTGTPAPSAGPSVQQVGAR